VDGALAVNAGTNTVYGADHSSGGVAISVINGSSNTMAATIQRPGMNVTALAVNEATNALYALDQGGTFGGMLSIIDGATTPSAPHSRRG
jgi:DNA-binding beta-propeller fold protein YncE